MASIPFLRTLPFGLVLLGALVAGAAPVRPPVPPATGSAGDPIALQDIVPGMTGYGLTVFGGAGIDTFGVTVIGVQHNVRPQGSLILVEVSGHGLELSSIAQGMSGSPIFLQGRLAGALAFGWSGALRPIAGVTPAQEILALPTTAVVRAGPLSGTGSGGATWGARDLVPWGTGSLAAAILDPAAAAGAAGLDPRGSAPDPRAPGAGVSPGDWPAPADLILPLLRDRLHEGPGFLPDPGGWILQPVGGSGGSSAGSSGGSSGGPAGGSEAAARAPAVSLRPGSACAVPLVMGDAVLGVIGTVTWVDGRDVFMMGHPFLQRGPVALPLATAEVLGVSRAAMSFKMGAVGAPVGTVHHDQRAGLSGKLGPVPPLIPVQVEVVGAGGEPAAARTFAFAVVDDPQLTPPLVFWALYNALLAAGDDASEQTVRYDVQTQWSGPAELADQGLRLQGIATGPGGVQGLALQWMTPLAMLLDHARQPVSLRQVTARLEVSRPMATARIVGLAGPRSLALGSGPVVFQVECVPRQGLRRTVELVLDPPRHLRPGNYRVVAASAAEFFALEVQRLGGNRDLRELAAMLEVLRSRRAGDQLVLALIAPGSGLVVQGTEMAGLPRSVARVLQAGSFDAGLTLADILVRTGTDTPWLLEGHAVDTLQLQEAGTPETDERRP